VLAHRRQVERGGSLVLRNIAPRILQIMRMAGFDRVFEIERDTQTTPTRADEQRSRQ
jgi:anti-anti-sigma regulatory factor